MNGRIYDPLLGRFLSADLLVSNPGSLQSFNRYSYVANNPLSTTDPSGFVSEKDLKLQREEKERKEREAARRARVIDERGVLGYIMTGDDISTAGSSAASEGADQAQPAATPNTEKAQEEAAQPSHKDEVKTKTPAASDGTGAVEKSVDPNSELAPLGDGSSASTSSRTGKSLPTILSGKSKPVAFISKWYSDNAKLSAAALKLVGGDPKRLIPAYSIGLGVAALKQRIAQGDISGVDAVMVFSHKVKGGSPEIWNSFGGMERSFRQLGEVTGHAPLILSICNSGSIDDMRDIGKAYGGQTYVSDEVILPVLVQGNLQLEQAVPSGPDKYTRATPPNQDIFYDINN